jgi:two-component system, response regulator YesN
MYKLLIVDDEKNIRLGIQTMISREFPTEFEIETALDGLDALGKIQSEKIDILITDIKMPRMDGIQLIQQIQLEENPIPALIILSGYDDFEYTKAAIKCKVKDYLLKPVNRSELFQTLKHVLEELELNTKKTYQHLGEFRTSQLNYILLNPTIPYEEVENLCRKMQLDEYVNGYYLAIFDHKKKIDGEDLLIRIKHFIESPIEGLNKNAICFLDKDDRVVVITEENVFLQVKEHLGKEKFLTFSTGISNHQRQLRDLKKAYQEACYALKYYFLFPSSQLIYYGMIKEKQGIMELPIDMIKKISNMLGTEREKELKSHLIKVLDYQKISEADISYMESLSEKINLIIFENFFSKLGDESVETYKLFNKVENMYNFDSFNDYYRAVEDLLMRLHEYNKQIRFVYSEQKYMEKAVCYINENFHKDLNLAVVSNYISLNYSYFSHMFKEYTGQNFVDYLKKVRIAEAKVLLTKQEYKIFEISEMVGYKNPKQFARVFREIEGISPKEFREQV